jgi:hypothetical protein
MVCCPLQMLNLQSKGCEKLPMSACMSRQTSWLSFAE